MTEEERESLLNQAKQTAIEFLSEKLTKTDDDSYDRDKNAKAIGDAIVVVRQTHKELDGEDLVSAVLAAYGGIDYDTDYDVFCRGTESLSTAFFAGEGVGCDYGYKCAQNDFDSDFRTYLERFHKGANSVDDVAKGFYAWWTKDDDDNVSSS